MHNTTLSNENSFWNTIDDGEALPKFTSLHCITKDIKKNIPFYQTNSYGIP